MAITIDPTVPADAESPRQGAARIRALTLELLQLLSQGGGAAVTFAAAPFSIDLSGNVTIPTSIVVPTPTLSSQATTKVYVDGQTVNAPSLTTTLSNTTITASDSATLFSLASTPPATPNNGQKFRALVSSTVYFQCSGSSTSDYVELAIELADNGSLFTTIPSSQNVSAVQGSTRPIVATSFCFLSQGTRTNAQGAVTFTLTGLAISSRSDSANIQAASDADANAKSILQVAWIPAQ